MPDLGVTLAGAFLVLGIGLFVVFLDRASTGCGRSPSRSSWRRRGARRFGRCSRSGRQADAPVIGPAPYETRGSRSLVVRHAAGGSIQASTSGGLGEVGAREHEPVIVLRMPVGDFVSAGALLMRGVRPGSRPRTPRVACARCRARHRADDRAGSRLRLRIMVDIAIRALSPAVNGPTTAVQVLDHLEDTAAEVARSGPLGSPGEAVAEEDVRPGSSFRCAAGATTSRSASPRSASTASRSIQVMRRLRAMLESSVEAVLPGHRAAVVDELARLDSAIAQRWEHQVDLDLAGAADRQGIGRAVRRAPRRAST